MKLSLHGPVQVTCLCSRCPITVLARGPAKESNIARRSGLFILDHCNYKIIPACAGGALRISTRSWRRSVQKTLSATTPSSARRHPPTTWAGRPLPTHCPTASRRSGGQDPCHRRHRVASPPQMRTRRCSRRILSDVPALHWARAHHRCRRTIVGHKRPSCTHTCLAR